MIVDKFEVGPVVSCGFAFLSAVLLVPIFSKFADRLGLVDKPDDARKLHKTPIPMVGGLTVFVSVLIVVSFVLFWFRDSIRFRPSDLKEITGLVLGGVILLLVGIVDDVRGIRGRQKLIGQIIAVTCLIAAGFEFQRFAFAGFQIEFGIFAVLIIYGWMLAAINSINLLDGADGFATTIGLVMFLSIGVMAMFLGKNVDAVIALGAAGALLGFLRYNFPPAKAFLGDHGSMLVGFLLGALAIRCSFKQATAYAFFAPIAILAIPFIDTGAAIIRRRLTGRSIYTVDRGHLHHRLQKQGYGPRVSLIWVGLLTSVTAIGGVLSHVNRQSEYALVSIAIVVLVLFSARIFGLAEFRLLSNKALSIGRSLVGLRGPKLKHQTSAVHMQGSRDWQEIWKEVCEFAEEHDLLQITMDLNVPWMHESFHATQRKTDGSKDGNQEWYVQLPLVVEHRVFGRIEMIGDRDGRFKYHHVVSNFLKIANDIETAIADLESQPSKIEVLMPRKNEKSSQEVSSFEGEDQPSLDAKEPPVPEGFAKDGSSASALK